MYNNLIKELHANHTTISSIAKLLHVHRNTVRRKSYNGQFKIPEAQMIQRYIFPNLNIDYLFAYTKEEICLSTK